MARRFKKKDLFIIIPILLVAVGVAGYFIWKNNSSSSSGETTVVVPKEIEVSNLMEYSSTQESYSEAYALLSSGDMTKYQTETNKLILIAANNTSYESEELKPFAAMPAEQKEVIRQYHIVSVPVPADGTVADLSLTDGKVLTTASGRELIVKKTDKGTVLIDVKGRSSKVQARYAIDPQDNRLYLVDSVLLLQ